MADQKIYNVVSFFSGCGGLDYGFHKGPFKILLANDSWNDAAKSFNLNYPDVPVLEKPIQDISDDELLNLIGNESVDVLIGGPPCQCFTRLNNNHLIRLSEQKKEDSRRILSEEYIRKVKILNPEIVLMENVKDLLVRKNKQGEFYSSIIEKAFGKIGYKSYFKIVSMDKYGVPQKRKRVIFLATNNLKLIEELDKNLDYGFPKESKKIFFVRDVLSKIKDDENLRDHDFVINDAETLKRIRMIPQGGYYEHLPDYLKVKKVRNGEKVIVKRYGSYFRRLHPDKVSPTITKNYMIHPFKDRYLTNREKAILHGFPKNYKFYGKGESVSQQIANAVPPKYSIRLAHKTFKMLEFCSQVWIENK